MIPGIDEYIINIAQHVSRSLGGTLDVATTRWVRHPTRKKLVKDASLAFYIDGKKTADDIVLLISNPRYGHTVEKDTERAREIASHVNQDLGLHIVAPIFQGRFEEQTYAAFSRLSPLSNFRLIRLFQKTATANRVVPWLSKLAKQTRETRDDPAEYERCFILPLQVLSRDKEVSRCVKDLAISTLDYVQKNKPDLFTIIEHGDFWIGNVLFEKRMVEDFNPFVGKFFVIDWRGAHLDGYPGIDLARFCLSLYKVDSRKIDALVDQYLGELDISRFDMAVYCTLALGRLGGELDQYPKERHCFLCDRIFEFLQFHALGR